MSEYLPDDYSDAGNAQLYSDSWRGLLCWVDALGWMRYNGKCWQQDDREAVKAAITLFDLMLDEARQEYEMAVQFEADAKKNAANEMPGAIEQLTEAKRAVKSSRLDGEALKAAMPEIVERFTRTTTTTRFTLTV